MLREMSFGVAALTLLAASPGEAASFNPKVDDICMAHPVPPGTRSRMSQRRLVEAVLSAQGLRDSDLDSDHDIGLSTRIDAIAHPKSFCTTTSKNCSENAPAKLIQANLSLLIFLDSNSRTVPADQSGFEIQPPIPESLDQRGLLNFLQGKGPYRLTCIAAATKPPEPKPSKEQQEIATALSGVLVRGKVTDLAAKLDKASSATVSFTADYIANQQTLAAGGVVGYQIPAKLIGDYSNAFAYFSYAGKRVSGTGASKSPDIGNVAGGLLGDFNIAALDYQNFQISAEYLHSYVTDTDLVTGKLVFTPNLRIPGFGLAYIPEGSPVAVWIKPQGIFLYGDVVHPGTNTSLIATNDYSRGGGRIELWLYGLTGFLQNFTFNTSYEYLKVWVGPFDNIWRWENTLSYNFPDAQNWSLQFKYSDGRNLDTLERERILTIGLGYKQ